MTITQVTHDVDVQYSCTNNRTHRTLQYQSVTSVWSPWQTEPWITDF